MLTYTLGSWVLGRTVDGWTSLSTIMLAIGSAQLMLFGVLGEYIGRLYIESKRRPLYVIDEIAVGRSLSIVTGAAVRSAKSPGPADGNRHPVTGQQTPR